jgi:hypothetical protein
MQTTFKIHRDRPQPNRNPEVDTFTHLLQQPTGRAILAKLGLDLPETFDLTHNTGRDDPPDLVVMGRGFEHTEFPPNQTARGKVMQERNENGLHAVSIAPLMKLDPKGKKENPMKAIREYADANEPTATTDDDFEATTSGMNSMDDEVAAMQEAFEKMLREKDVPGNDVLLLDGRADGTQACVVGAGIQRGLANYTPSHFRLIVLVRRASFQMFPAFDQAFMASRP